MCGGRGGVSRWGRRKPGADVTGIGLFTMLFGVVTGWAGWHNYNVLDVFGAVLRGQQLDKTGTHAGGQGLKQLVTFSWSDLLNALNPLSALGKALGGTGGVAGAAGAAAPGATLLPSPSQAPGAASSAVGGLGGILGGLGSGFPFGLP